MTDDVTETETAPEVEPVTETETGPEVEPGATTPRRSWAPSCR